MVTFQQETLYDVIDEVGPLLELHYSELTLNKERVKLDPQWERYAMLEAAGAFVIYTARADGELVGYSAFFVNRHMHYAGLTVACNDVLFVRPDQRGTTGLRLITFSITELVKWLDHPKIMFHAKLSNNLQTILVRLGFTVEEVMLGKIY